MIKNEAPTAWPPNYIPTFMWRQEELLKLRSNPDLLFGAKEYYRTRPVQFIMDWVDTYDPRNAGKDGMLTRMPFLLFPRQKEMIRFLQAMLEGEEDGLIEKCRDAGATWLCVAFSVWLWLFWPGVAIGWGSRKEQYVDKLGVIDSIFEKIRQVIKGLPPEFLPVGFSMKDHLSYMRIINPENGSTIVGEAGDNIGRGGRTRIYFKDEAQPLTARILTPDGWRTMGDMVKGSEVIGVDGKRLTVTNINNVGEADTYRFTFSDGSSTECSENHLWVFDKVIGKKERVTKRSWEIAENFEYRSPKGQRLYRYRAVLNDVVEFSKVDDLPLDPYVVGVLLGDGSIKHVPKYRPKFTSKDPEIAERVAGSLPDDCKLTVTDDGIEYRLCDIQGRRGRFKVSRASQAIVRAGIAGHGSETKFIPEQYLHSSPADRLSVLQGLMDTDGYANCHGGASFHTCSRDLANGVKFIVRSLGGVAFENVKNDPRGYLPQIVVTVVLPERFNPFHIERKASLLRRKQKMTRTLVNVEKLGNQIVRCITVNSNDGLYVTDDFIVTHNSAHYERPELVEAALGDNTRCQIDISSVNGIGNVFHRKRENGEEWSDGEAIPDKTNVFIFDWRDHPAKTQEWYDKRKAKWESDGLGHLFAQEVDRDYSSSVEGIMIKPEWVQAAIDAHVKLGIEPTGRRMSGVDVADEGLDKDGYVSRKGILIDIAETFKFADVGALTRHVVKLSPTNEPVELFYDSIGVGAGVKSEANRLKSENKLPKNITFHPWSASAKVLWPGKNIIPGDKESPLNKDYYSNVKAQAWSVVAQRFYKTWQAVTENASFDPEEIVSLDSKMKNLHTLVRELSQATASLSSSTMKIVVNKTPEGTKSPNMADSAIMSLFPVRKSTYSLDNVG